MKKNKFFAQSFTAVFTALAVLFSLSVPSKAEENLCKDSNQIEGVSKETKASVLKKVSGNLSNRAAFIYIGSFCSGSVMEDGSLYTWGENFQGCLGDGTTEDRLRPVKVLDNVQQFETDNGHSGAVAKDGSLYMWGRNIEAQIGTDTDAMYLEKPVKVLDHVQSISLGSWSTGAVTKDGSMYAWGMNREGQLGNGTEGEKQGKPEKTLENVRAIELNATYGGAVTRDGSLYMWGTYDSDIVKGSRGEPVKILAHVLKYMSNDDDLLPMYGALTEDGSLYIWGSEYGVVDVPKKVLDNVQDFSMGSMHIGAVTKDGSLYMWESADPVIGPSPVIGPRPADAVTKDGSLYMCGYNNSKNQSKPVKIMNNVRSVSLNGMNSAAIKTDGSLYMWGDNSFGQIGDGTTKNHSKPVKVMENVQTVYLTGSSSGAITIDGNLYMWGNNENGQLGDGTKKNRKKPVRVSFSDKASQTITYQTSGIKKKKVIYGSVFSLNAETSGKGRLIYQSSAPNILTVDPLGKVTVKGYGPVSIKIKASDGNGYKAAVRKIKLIAVPGRGKVTKAVQENGAVRFKWQPEKTADGYEYAFAYNKKFSGQSRKKTSKTGLVLTKYKTGTKKMYFKVRTYKKAAKKTYYGSWSKVRPLKLKKVRKVVESSYRVVN